ncbi:MAG: CinA family protein [Pseudomonadota bacterium]
MFPADLILAVEELSADLLSAKASLVTAESCTGGLIAGAMTDRAGSSVVFERGFVTYSNEAKVTLLGVPETDIITHGAVSEQVARAMATGALRASHATHAVAVTGVAGPGGGTDKKPVGLVHIAAASADTIIHAEQRYGDQSRSAIRLATVRDALALVSQLLAKRFRPYPRP